MGWRFLLYRSPSELPPMQWEEDMAAPIGTREEVVAALEEMLPVEWQPFEGGLWAQVRDPQGGEAFHVTGYEFTPGVVGMLAPGHRTPPSVLAALMDRFALDRCCTDYGEFRDPHACDDDWRPLPR